MNSTHLKQAYIIDLDGVVSHSEFREKFKEQADGGQFDWFNNMIPHFRANPWATGLVKALSHTYTIIFLTARNESFRLDTVNWLHRHVGISNFKLIMRDEEGASDYDIKRKLYLEKIRGKYNVLAAIDDKEEICKLWKELNIQALWLYENKENNND